MNRRKQRQIGSLILLLLVGGLLTFRVWRQLREDLLSTQLMTVLKDLYSPLETSDDPKGQQRERFLQRNRRDEVQALRLLREGANPNTRDFATLPRTFWEEIKYLMKRISEPPSKPKYLPPSALALAVQADDTVLATALLKAGATDINAELDINLRDYRFHLVNYAAYAGNLEIVQALCARGADLHTLGHNSNVETGYSPDPTEQQLVRPEEEPILQSVLRGGAEDVQFNEKSTASEQDLDRRRRIEIFHLLLAHGAKYDPHSKEGYALLAVAAEGDFLELTRELLAAGVLPNADPDWLDDPPTATPLDYAVNADDIPLVDLLLRYGAYARDYRSEPPMRYVGNVQMAKLLLKHGADLQAGQVRGKHEGENRLDWACQAGDNKEVMFWINLGIDLNIGGDNPSPIAEAAEYAGVSTVRLLLQHGAKVGPNSPGADALCLAIAEQHFESAKLLLRYGAAVNPPSGSLATRMGYPLTQAASQDSVEMVLELLKRGANVNAHHGEALFEACGSCNEDLVEILLEHGADPNVRSDDGKTPIQVAQENADPRTDADGIVALLKDYGAKR